LGQRSERIAALFLQLRCVVPAGLRCEWRERWVWGERGTGEPDDGDDDKIAGLFSFVARFLFLGLRMRSLGSENWEVPSGRTNTP
jgi:hypothetical protein